VRARRVDVHGRHGFVVLVGKGTVIESGTWMVSGIVEVYLCFLGVRPVGFAGVFGEFLGIEVLWAWIGGLRWDVRLSKSSPRHS